MDKNNFVEGAIGVITIIISILFLVFIYNKSTRYRFQYISGYTVKAQFDNVNGLSVGNDIKVKGVTVGKVKSINLDTESLLVTVEIYINDQIKLPIDSIAIITSNGILSTSKYIDIIVGAQEKILEDNSFISYTQSALNFESIVNKVLNNWK